MAIRPAHRWGPWEFRPESGRLVLDDTAAAETWDGPPSIRVPEIGDAEAICETLATVAATARRPHRDLGTRGAVAEVLGWLLQAMLALSWGAHVNRREVNP